MGKKLFIFALIICIGLPALAWSGPQVKIAVFAEKEVKSEEAGMLKIKRVQADTVEPGETVFYTLKYENQGDEKATEVVVNNPIPEGTTYLQASTYGDGSTVYYSIDNGKTFKKPEDLIVSYTTHDGKKMTRRAYASEYTHIQWVVGEVPSGSSGVLGFQVQVK